MSKNRGSNQRHGYFRCSDCRQGWESSHVYVKNNGQFPEQVQFGQECGNCIKECKPYRLEKLRCSMCHQQRCVCEDKRHNEPNKGHRSDLCLRCKSGRPCVQN
ncbi:hypothetical protein SNE40_011262 [Patella caerulea]|uniref:3CxxC-type domain-containing protein n=1 Tax=Patella caerulea TaxID=87958 RepID=A0AAN8JN90_PATCE